MNENTCFFIITDGFGSVNVPNPLLNLINMLSNIRRNGCATCAYCFWWNFAILRRSRTWQAERENVFEVCKRLDAPVIELNERNYKQRAT